MLRSELFDYSNGYIVVKRTLYFGVVGVVANNATTQKGVLFKNNAPFRSCISKINNIFIDNAEDFDVVITMYNLLEYSENYSMTSKICDIIIEMKCVILVILIIMLQRVNHFSIRQK